MDIYKIEDLGHLLARNPHPGRGIVVGKSADSRHAAVEYLIMGSRENSRKRVVEAKEDSIRDVIAFPKVKDASCLMTEAPAPVDPKQLEELEIAVARTE